MILVPFGGVNPPLTHPISLIATQVLGPLRVGQAALRTSLATAGRTRSEVSRWSCHCSRGSWKEYLSGGSQGKKHENVPLNGHS